MPQDQKRNKTNNGNKGNAGEEKGTPKNSPSPSPSPTSNVAKNAGKTRGSPSNVGKTSVIPIGEAAAAGNPKDLGESTYGASAVPGAARSAYKKKELLRIPKEVPKDVLASLGICASKLKAKGYHPMKLLGEGNYAKVYQVRENSGRHLAVKIINCAKDEKNSSEYLVHFLPRELKIIQKLKHDYITCIFEIFTCSSKFIYIVMEFAANGTVAERLATKEYLPEKEVRGYFSKSLEALHYMHSLGIAHRDLKLENILLDHKLNPKLSDFSYSVDLKKAEVDPKTGLTLLSKTFCGTLPYLCPEILANQPYEPKSSDIWSFGVCLFIMLNNSVPFKYEDPEIMLKQQLARSWKIRPRLENQISAQVKSLLKRMLEPRVSDRPTSTSIMLDPWVTGKTVGKC